MQYDNEENEDDEHKNGHIPVMIITCKNFKLPKIKCDIDDIDDDGNTLDDKAKCKYIINHIKKCDDCDKINNDKSNFINFFQNSIINFEKINETSIEYDIIVNYYHSVKKYNPFGDSIEKSTGKLYFINDDDSIYDKCILFTWSSV